MRQLAMLVLLALGLAACGTPTLDRAAATDFRPTALGFEFRAPIAINYPDNPTGEADRMTMLKGWLEQNSTCPGGYEIVTRQVVQRTGLLADVHYTGRCKV